MCELTAVLCTTGYLYFNRDSLLLNIFFEVVKREFSCSDLMTTASLYVDPGQSSLMVSFSTLSVEL